MRDLKLEKAIAAVLWATGDVWLRKSVLADEAEIRLRRGITSAEFDEAIQSMRNNALISKDADAYGEECYNLTPAGRRAARAQ